jgi:hypothetical protein
VNTSGELMSGADFVLGDAMTANSLGVQRSLVYWSCRALIWDVGAEWL